MPEQLYSKLEVCDGDQFVVRVDELVRRVQFYFFFFSSRRRHTRLQGDWSSDVCSSDLDGAEQSGFTQLPRKRARLFHLWGLLQVEVRVAAVIRDEEFSLRVGAEPRHLDRKSVV